jgi:hypothetical protein
LSQQHQHLKTQQLDTKRADTVQAPTFKPKISVMLESYALDPFFIFGCGPELARLVFPDRGSNYSGLD